MARESLQVATHSGVEDNAPDAPSTGYRLFKRQILVQVKEPRLWPRHWNLVYAPPVADVSRGVLK